MDPTASPHPSFFAEIEAIQPPYLRDIRFGLLYPRDRNLMNLISTQYRLLEMALGGDGVVGQERMQKMRQFAANHGSSDYQLLSVMSVFFRVGFRHEALMDAVATSIKASAVAEVSAAESPVSAAREAGVSLIELERIIRTLTDATGRPRDEVASAIDSLTKRVESMAASTDSVAPSTLLKESGYRPQVYLVRTIKNPGDSPTVRNSEITTDDLSFMLVDVIAETLTEILMKDPGAEYQRSVRIEITDMHQDHPAVKRMLEFGEMIDHHPDDNGFPSKLTLLQAQQIIAAIHNGATLGHPRPSASIRG